MPKESCFIGIDYLGCMMFAVPRTDQEHITYSMPLEQI